MNRRAVLKAGVGVAALAVASEHAQAVAGDLPIVDTNVSLFRWPFRRLPLDEPDALLTRLRTLGVTEAWAGSFEALLQRDMSAVNRRLVALCGRFPFFKPVGCVNPKLPGWREDLRQCVEVPDLRAVRLYPNYHGYALDEPVFRDLLRAVGEAGLLLQIAASMEDTRTQSRLVQVPDVDLRPLGGLLAALPETQVQLLNWRPRPAVVAQLAKLPGVFFDTARLDGTDGVPALVRALPPGRVWYGSHAPFLVPEAALIRVHESGRLEDREVLDVLGGNAARRGRR